MSFQRCPSCQRRNDVSVYAHGWNAKCAYCGLSFTVDRERGDARPSASGATPARSADVPTQVSGAPADQSRPSPPVSPTAGAAALQMASAPEPAVPPSAPVLAPQRFPTPAERPQAIASPREEAAKGQARPNIPGFDCLELLGRGGMGEVWKARQQSLNRVVAVKILSPTLAVEPDFVRRFERESSALAALSHPNIVQVFDRGSAFGHWYFVMEMVEGKSLRDKQADTALARRELLRLVAQVARAVDYAHGRGVIHRDLKPENILVDHQGNAKVADFGLAGMSEVGRSSLTMTAVAMGTAHYMAPEQRKDAKNVDGRADLYSIGVMLYELTTGELPAGRFQTPKEKVAGLDDRLDRLILRLLDQDPQKRPETGGEVAGVLEALVADTQGETALLPPPARKSHAFTIGSQIRRSKPKAVLFLAAVAILIAIVAVTLAHSIRQSGPPRLETPLPARVERPKAGQAAVTFGGGEKDVLFAVGGGWQSTAGGLLGDASEPGPPRARRAYLMPLRLTLSDARLGTEVVLQDGPTAAKPPSAELVLSWGDGEVLAVRLTLGEDAGYQLLSSTRAGGHLVRRVIGSTREPDPRPGRAHYLQLFVINGQVTALADHQRVASTLVDGLSGVEAKAALGCRAGRCLFRSLRLSGNLVAAARAGNK